jgi:hypothetical protein
VFLPLLTGASLIVATVAAVLMLEAFNLIS